MPQKRQVLEEAEMLDPRISALEEDLDEVESSEEEDEEEEKVKPDYPQGMIFICKANSDPCWS